jgi:hypothetical protein
VTAPAQAPGFADEAELVNLVGRLFELAFSQPQVTARLVRPDLVLHLISTDPDCSLIVDFGRRQVHAGSNAPVAPNARVEASGAVINQYCQGQLNLTQAIADGLVRIGGAIAPLLAHLPPSADLARRYRAMVLEQGRADLLL